MPRRVFIGMNEAAGYYRGLCDGFRDLGIETMFVDEFVSPYDYSRPSLLGRSGVALTAARAARSHSRSLAARTMWSAAVAAIRAARLVMKLMLFTRAIATCDAFVFASGETFFRHHDLVLLRRLGKRVVVVFTGSDHRPPYLNGRLVRAMAEMGTGPLIEQTVRVARRVAQVEEYADAIVANTASAQFHRRPYIEAINLGLPISLESRPTSESTVFTGMGVRILHAPSDRDGKGSDRIKAAVRTLEVRGHAIDYVEITNRPNAEVLAAIRDCDFVVDEVFSDSPIAMFSTEAAILGKPAVVGGYFAGVARQVISAEAMPPTLFCMPDDLEEAIERMSTDIAFRTELGRRAQEFVSTHWSPRQVAQRYVQILDGDIQPEWLAHPCDSGYLRGWGMSEDTWRDGIRRIVAAGGVEALCLKDNPDVEAALLAKIDTDAGGRPGPLPI